ncbi:baseplate wedge subunit and tail pin [Vibrio phage nt-1]|uniref:Baseplate wedge subunit and tail pin n=1 Tax=Vibrio phage nt-1 TaxID=115992 RepID=R9TF03_9CAUD|nr:baseplate wedge subunit [Vibrio phage nt-1]AGN30019.2 baseplate wedge subunit and tail pin [Vibrio phage nt-1]
MTSKARHASRVWSNDSRMKIFDQNAIGDSGLFPGDRFNFRGAVLGDSTIDEIQEGAWDPNVQAAIMQLAMAAIMPIGTIIPSTDSTNPFNTNQFNETITYSGTSTVDNISLYGVSVQLLVGDSDNDIAEKVFTALHASNLFDTDPTDHVPPSNTFVLKHRSSRPHNTAYSNTLTDILDPEGSPTGIQAQSVITGSSDGQRSLGYGEWELYYTDSTTFGDIVYYYRRIA